MAARHVGESALAGHQGEAGRPWDAEVSEALDRHGCCERGPTLGGAIEPASRRRRPASLEAADAAVIRAADRWRALTMNRRAADLIRSSTADVALTRT